MQSAQRVRRRLLAKLEISPSPDEDELHRQIGDYQYTATQRFVRRADRWLGRVLDANARRRVFDEDALRSHVEERRAEIHAAERARRSTTRLIDRSLDAVSRRLLRTE